MRPSLLWLAALSLCACGGDADPPIAPGAPVYPKDASLTLADAQWKATHNSYHVETPGNTLPDWKYTMPPLDAQLEQDGVRSVELDVHWVGEGEPIRVHHLDYLDETSTCATLVEYLTTLRHWSDAHPGHLALYVQMELKSGFTVKNSDVSFAALHAEIASVWPPSRVVTPAGVRGDAPTLREAVAARGWPTLGETRQKIFFGLDEDGPLRDAYTHGGVGLDDRLCFIESAPADPYAALAIVNDPRDATAIDAALSAGMLVRVFGTSLDGPPADNDVAAASGAHFVSTDYPADAPDPTRTLRLPGGAPARCNPRTAPADCTAADIEHR